MIVKVKKRKAGSYRDLAFEEYQVSKANTLEELLFEITKIELDTVKDNQNLYNRERYSFEKAVEIIKQDFEDGLFRVFFNQKEYTFLEENLQWQEEDQDNELVLIRLVMMAGRL